MEENKFIDLETYNLNCTIKNKKEEKTILNGINCKFSSGKLIGILGPSGSGKTTLLNSLSGYQYENSKAGAIKLNGFEMTFKDLRRLSSYVTQDIHLNNLLTIEENMKYVADFKLGSKIANYKQKIILELLASFGLEESSKTKSGKLSGGEKKRLAIALEMISDPDIVFIDEPTTGLDIINCGQILKYLKTLAQKGKMVIASAHQVTAKHFEMFDLVYILGEGRCVYQGPPKQLVPYLEQLDLPCNIYHNPADYIIELCCGDFGEDKLELLVQASQNGLKYLENNCDNENEKENLQRTLLKNKIKENQSWFYNFSVLLQREFIKSTRNLILTYLRIIAAILIAVSIGGFFFDAGNDASKIFPVYNMALCIVGNLFFCGVMVPIIAFPLDMNVVKREIHNDYYTVGQYYLTTTLLDLPISLFCYTTAALIIYTLNGQPLEFQRIQMYLIIIIIGGLLMQALGFCIGTMLSVSDGIFFGVVMQLPLLVLSGFGLFFSHLPWYFEYFSQILYPRRSLEGILISFWGNNREQLVCKEESVYCYYKDIGKFLKEIGIDENNYWTDVAFLLGWYFSLKVLTNFTLRWRIFSHKRLFFK